MKIKHILSSLCFILGLKSLSEQLDCPSTPLDSPRPPQKTSLPNSPDVKNPATSNRKII